MPLDPSQRAAEPTPTGSLGDLRGAERVELANKPGQNADTVKANDLRAAAELAMINELKQSAAFQWFEAEFIDKPYAASFDALRAEATTEDDAFWRRINAKYVALREVKSGMIQREIVHLKRISPIEPAIAALTQHLRTL